MDLAALYSSKMLESYSREFAELGCAQIYDAAHKYCIAMDPAIVTRTPGRKLAAPVFPTVTDNDMLPCLQAMDAVPPGWALLIHNRSQTSEALAGDIYCTAAAAQNVAGLVIDGAVRDIEFFETLDLPVYSRSVTFVSAKTAQVPAAEVPTSIEFGGGTVEPGDWIFGDLDGLLIVKARYLTAAFNAARLLGKTEETFRASLRGGNRLGDLIGLTDFLAGKGTLRAEI